MSEQYDDHSPAPDRDDNETPQAHPSEMRLRPDRPPVMRLSRKVLLGLVGVTAVGVAGALFFALKPHLQTGGSELYNTNNRATPEGLANLPHDYTGLPHTVPQLGPPLPGDLGKPILNAGAPAPGISTPGARNTRTAAHRARTRCGARKPSVRDDQSGTVYSNNSFDERVQQQCTGRFGFSRAYGNGFVRSQTRFP